MTEVAKKICVIFQGQGGQEEGMGENLVKTHPEVATLYQQASDILGYSPLNLTSEHLKSTAFVQPAVFTFNEACRIAFMKERRGDEQIAYYAGNSLGELNAMLAAGAYNFEDGLNLVKARGLGMDFACAEYPSGLMALVGPSKFEGALFCLSARREFKRQASHLLDGNGGGLFLEADNSLTQIVVGGTNEKLKQVQELFEESGFSRRGFRLVRLNTAGAFHSDLMKPAEPFVKEALEKITLHDAKVPVIANTTARPISRAGQMEQEITDHLTKPVLWRQSMDWVRRAQVTAIVELGKKDTLTKMMRDRGKIVATGAGLGIAAAGIAALLYFRNSKNH